MPCSAGAESALVVDNWIQYIFPDHKLKLYSSLNLSSDDSSFSGTALHLKEAAMAARMEHAQVQHLTWR